MNAANEKHREPPYWRALSAEFVGTAALVIVAAGADTIEAVSGGQIGHVARYLSPGLLIVALIWSFSAISGAHVNPAVTLAFVMRGVFPVRKAFGYWVVQFAGGVAGAMLLRAFFGGAIEKGVTHAGPGISLVTAFGWEATITALLVLVIISTAAEKAIVGKNAALAVGFTVALCGLFSSPITGASMNPARSFGPQVAALDFDGAWVYFAGPVVGAAVAVALSFILHGRHPEEAEAAQGGEGEA
jgi:aquaporin Z